MNDETEHKSVVAALKGWRAWDVGVKNNYYDSRYTSYSTRMFRVVAATQVEARQVVLDNSGLVLETLLNMKRPDGRKVLPQKSALPINENRVADANRILPSTVTSIKPIDVLTPEGAMMLQFNGGKICG
jgi:hypothetical protein